MSLSFPPPVSHPAGHGHTDQPAAGPTLPGMPHEITDHILSFTPPDSVRACRAVSRALRYTGEGALQELAERVTGLSSDSSLYGLIQNRFASFSLHLQSDPGSSYLQFHLSLSEGIVSLGVPGRPNRILSLQEIEQCNTIFQSLQDSNLMRIWGPLREQIMRTHPQPAGILWDNASAQQIRSWMHADANQPALQRITRLDLSDQGLTCVPLEIRLCTALQGLKLNSNQIASLPATVFQGLTSLETLNLSSNQIASLPATFFQGLTSLQQLYLYSNQIASLPATVFQGLTSLQWISLANNQIATLPATVFQGLTSLQTLHLFGNQIASLPATVFQGLTSLQTLNLSSNQIASLPATVFQGLTSLRELYLSNNQIATLPATLFQGLNSLRRLLLSSNPIATLPATLFQGLTSLQTLNLSSNQIASLTANVFQGLTSLQSLDLNRNQIATLPATVFQGLTSLQTLSLDRNQIASLTANVFQGLTSLQQLNLSSNRIATLAETVFQGLTSLQMLYLYGNPPLLISYNDFRNYSNNIEFPDMTRAFFNYPCQSPLAQLYQLAAGDGSPEAVRELFAGLPDNIKNAIYGKVWVEAGRPNTGDPQWGEHHTFDDMPIFYGALKRYVRECFEGLTNDQKNAVYRHVSHLARGEGIDVDSVPGWGSTHACDNILRLIDAMAR